MNFDNAYGVQDAEHSHDLNTNENLVHSQELKELSLMYFISCGGTEELY